MSLRSRSYWRGSASIVAVRSACTAPGGVPKLARQFRERATVAEKSVRVRWISSRSTPSKEKCWKIATMSENPSWNAYTSGLLGSRKCGRRRCTRA